MFRQHAVHDVLVDVDPEGPRDTRDPWTSEAKCFRELEALNPREMIESLGAGTTQVQWTRRRRARNQGPLPGPSGDDAADSERNHSNATIGGARASFGENEVATAM